MMAWLPIDKTCLGGSWPSLAGTVIVAFPRKRRGCGRCTVSLQGTIAPQPCHSQIDEASNLGGSVATLAMNHVDRQRRFFEVRQHRLEPACRQFVRHLIGDQLRQAKPAARSFQRAVIGIHQKPWFYLDADLFGPLGERPFRTGRHRCSGKDPMLRKIGRRLGTGLPSRK